ncbi:MAG: ABC transporter permease [Anaerolineales bacterium]|nr:ABC transporter permease [Anaerolineales bacterium]
MRILYLAMKDLSQIIRQKKSALFLLILPVLFTGLLGAVFTRNGQEDPRLPVALAMRDAGALGAYYETLLGYSDTIHPTAPGQTDAASLEQLVRSQKAAAAVIIPEGFSRQTLAGESPRLTVIVDRNAPAGQAADRAIQLAATRLLGAVQTARLGAEAHGPFGSEAARQEYLLASLADAVRAWRDPLVRVTARPAGTGNAAADGFAQASPGMMVFFATIGMITPGYLLLAERRSRTLARMLTTDIRRAEIIAGHTLAMFVAGFLQVILLTLFGQAAFGLDYWRDPAALLLMAGVLALWSAAFGLLIGTLARDENQVVLLVMGATLVFGFVGGAFFPLDLAGAAYAAVGRMMPSAWAIRGFQDIILRAAGWKTVTGPAAILVLYALAFYALAVLRFQSDAAR